MASHQHTQTQITIDGTTYLVPDTFASFYASFGDSIAELGIVPGNASIATILGGTVGTFRTFLGQIEASIKGFGWSQILQYVKEADVGPEAYKHLSDFAKGDFTVIDEAFVALRDFLSKYPDSTSILDAFGDIEGYNEAIEGAIQDFNETLTNQIFVGEPGANKVEFNYDRADYKVSVDADGAIVITGPGGGSAKLIDIHQLQFSDIAYNLQIAGKAASVAPEIVNSLIDLYIAYFNRVPEADGLGYWIDQYKDGKSLDAIATDFYNSAIILGDFTGYSNDMPLHDYILMAYENVLGRTGDLVAEEDVQWWIREISEGRASREGIPARFISDSRIVAYDPEKAEQWGWMADYLDNRVELGLLHAVTYGVDYLSQADAHNRTVAITKLVTPESITEAVSLIGLTDDDFV